MKKLAWTFTAGFLATLIAFAVLSAVVMKGLEEPVPGWLSDSGGR